MIRNAFVGQTVEILANFSEDSTPLVSSNPTLYPNYTLKDVDNDVVLFGVASYDATTKLYKANITIPLSAKVSTPESKWLLEWQMIDDAGKDVRINELFDVALPTFDTTELKESQKVSLNLVPTIISIPIQTVPTSIAFNLYEEEEIIHTASTPVQEGVFNEMYIYKVTIPANTMEAGKEYGGIWTFDTGSSQLHYVKIYAIDNYMLSLISDLRLLCDKTLKDIDLYIGYRDSDLVNAVINGLNYINTIVQFTTWEISFFKGQVQFRPALLMSAAWWLLQSQRMAEGDSAFDYSGQAVSLTQDRTSFISEALGDFKAYLDDTFEKQKKHFLRSGGQQNFHLGTTYPNPNVGVIRSGVSARALGRNPYI